MASWRLLVWLAYFKLGFAEKKCAPCAAGDLCNNLSRRAARDRRARGQIPPGPAGRTEAPRPSEGRSGDGGGLWPGAASRRMHLVHARAHRSDAVGDVLDVRLICFVVQKALLLHAVAGLRGAAALDLLLILSVRAASQDRRRRAGGREGRRTDGWARLGGWASGRADARCQDRRRASAPQGETKRDADADRECGAVAWAVWAWAWAWAWTAVL